MFDTELNYIRLHTCAALRTLAARIDSKGPLSPNSDQSGSAAQEAFPEAPEGSWEVFDLDPPRPSPTYADLIQTRQEIDGLDAKIDEAVRKIDLTPRVIEESITDLHLANRRIDAAISRLENRA